VSIKCECVFSRQSNRNNMKSRHDFSFFFLRFLNFVVINLSSKRKKDTFWRPFDVFFVLLELGSIGKTKIKIFLIIIYNS